MLLILLVLSFQGWWNPKETCISWIIESKKGKLDLETIIKQGLLQLLSFCILLFTFSCSINTVLTRGCLASVAFLCWSHLEYHWLLSVILFCTALRGRTSQHKLNPSCVSDWILKHKSFILVFFKMLLPDGTSSLCWQMLCEYGKQQEVFRSLVHVSFHSNLEIVFPYTISGWFFFRGNKGIRHLTPEENSRSWL